MGKSANLGGVRQLSSSRLSTKVYTFTIPSPELRLFEWRTLGSQLTQYTPRRSHDRSRQKFCYGFQFIVVRRWIFWWVFLSVGRLRGYEAGQPVQMKEKLLTELDRGHGRLTQKKFIEKKIQVGKPVVCVRKFNTLWLNSRRIRLTDTTCTSNMKVAWQQ